MNLIERAKRLRPLIVKAAQYLEDNDAVQAVELYENWSGNSVEYKKDYKLRYDGKVYKVITPHTSQTDWKPNISTSLFTIIDEVHSGTLEDPIPYSVNMEIFNGKYYIENNIIYLCTRDSGIALHNNLKDLVSIYVEIVSEE